MIIDKLVKDQMINYQEMPHTKFLAYTVARIKTVNRPDTIHTVTVIYHIIGVSIHTTDSLISPLTYTGEFPLPVC